jgi:hypothetical protein
MEISIRLCAAILSGGALAKNSALSGAVFNDSLVRIDLSSPMIIFQALYSTIMSGHRQG